MFELCTGAQVTALKSNLRGTSAEIIGFDRPGKENILELVEAADTRPIFMHDGVQ